ncbi:MAG: hypothetical protein ACI4EG_12865 [Fusicatenibacter sp.]
MDHAVTATQKEVLKAFHMARRSISIHRRENQPVETGSVSGKG